jgi:hypothetical protein
VGGPDRHDHGYPVNTRSLPLRLHACILIQRPSLAWATSCPTANALTGQSPCAQRLSTPTSSSPSWTWGDPYHHFWSNGQWIEGNVVVTPKGTLVDILRANVGAGAGVDGKSRKERAAILQISEDGTKLSHDRDLINFVGERSSLRFGMILSQSAIGRSAANRLTLLRTGTRSCSPHHLTSTIGKSMRRSSTTTTPITAPFNMSTANSKETTSLSCHTRHMTMD